MLVTLLIVISRPKRLYEHYCIRVISKRTIGQARRDPDRITNPTKPGHVARNELDSHADTCCAGANWAPMLYTGEHCEVSPFLNTYDPVKEIPIARCCTVWTSDEGKEYLLVGDEMLWFGNTLTHSLLNPNQLRAYGLLVKDNPFDANEFGIDADEDFIPFETMGTIVYFDSRVPTDWETTHLPAILLTADTWDPKTINLSSGHSSHEEAEMRIV